MSLPRACQGLTGSAMNTTAVVAQPRCRQLHHLGMIFVNPFWSRFEEKTCMCGNDAVHTCSLLRCSRGARGSVTAVAMVTPILPAPHSLSLSSRALRPWPFKFTKAMHAEILFLRETYLAAPRRVCTSHFPRPCNCSAPRHIRGRPGAVAAHVAPRRGGCGSLCVRLACY